MKGASLVVLVYLVMLQQIDGFMVAKRNLASRGSNGNIMNMKLRVEYNKDTSKNTSPIALNTFAADKGFRVCASLLTIFSLLSAQPLPSHASYGAGSAAVTSLPEVKRLSAKEYISLSPSKQRQLELGVSCDPGDKNCVKNVDALINDFKNYNKELAQDQSSAVKDLNKQKIQQFEEEDKVKYGKLEEKLEKREKEYEQQLSKRQSLEESLVARSAMLNKLGNQPGFIVYGAAGLGSVVSTLIMHPLDTLKVRLISKQEGEEEAENGDGLDIGSLYNGILANLVKEAPASALYLGIYEVARNQLFASGLVGSPLLVYLLAGAIGELFGSIVRAPTEAVKTRIQLTDITLGDACRKVLLEEEGRASTFQSWSASLLRDVPMGAVQIALFEGLKTFIINSPNIELDVSSLSAEALIGAFGGAVGALVSTPADIITTLTIAAAESGLDGGPPSRWKDVPPAEIARTILKEEGVAGFFTGAVERVGYWAPAIGIFLSVYCSFRQAALTM